MSIRRAWRLSKSRIDRIWRHVLAKIVFYYCAVFKIEDKDRDFKQYGVVSAKTAHQAKPKAVMAEKVINVDGWPFCKHECIVPISIMAFRVLKRNSYDIDSFFDKQGNLIA